MQAGICGMLTGQALVLLVLWLSGNAPWVLGVGRAAVARRARNGLVIAPNQDFVLADVPRTQAGTAGGALITAQRLGAAIGIAVIGTALFGGGSGGGGWARGCARPSCPAGGPVRTQRGSPRW